MAQPDFLDEIINFCFNCTLLEHQALAAINLSMRLARFPDTVHSGWAIGSGNFSI